MLEKLKEQGQDFEWYPTTQSMIKVVYEDFIKQFQITPDNIDKEWLRGISTANGRNYDIYTFDSLGISLWVWRKKILEIMISSIDDE